MIKIIIFILSVLFVFFSFYPTYYEIKEKDKLPKDRYFVLEHNYLFDYNFYLSRIREGQEGRWIVTEKYYNRAHPGSLFQVVYLYLGKIGQIFRADPPFVYHASRVIFGFLLLLASGIYALKMFKSYRSSVNGNWIILAFLFLVTMGSWPILVKIGDFYRSATYMGNWSVMDSLSRITTIPHVLIGQLFLILIIRRFSAAGPKRLRLVFWGAVGLLGGIIFPPTLIIVYAFFLVQTVLEFIHLATGWQIRKQFRLPKAETGNWIANTIVPRLVFGLMTVPSLVYLQLMFRVQPWKALALFDVLHRIPLIMTDYILAMGPVFVLGVFGLLVVLVRGDKAFFPAVSWVGAIFLLIKVFENVPQQSPTRFTEGLINVPLGILASYLFYQLWRVMKVLGRMEKPGKVGLIMVIGIVLAIGLFVMHSMVGWLTDQVQWRREGTWKVALGAQLIYPINDFMDGVKYFRDFTSPGKVVLGYITSGNFIPAYAGNYVYIGHANTPDEDTKEIIAAKFFRGEMNQEDALNFLKKENVSYIFFGPQEQELGSISDLKAVYPFITPVYSNPQVVIYKV